MLVLKVSDLDMPEYIKPYNTEDGLKFSVIWTNPGPFHYCSEHAMSKYRFLCDVITTAKNKFWPVVVCGYEFEASHKFAATLVKKV